MYEKEDNKLKVTKEVITIHSLEDLYVEKQRVESMLARADAQRDAEYALYQPKLSEVDTLIAEAVRLDIKEEKESEEGMMEEVIIEK